MKISRFLNQTLLDYPGKLAAIVFTSGCNFKCPACHAKHVIYGNEKISEQEIFSYLDFAKGFIGAVVISGGEPTLQSDLAEFAGNIKEKNIVVKLDTNGSNPKVLEYLLKNRLIDYVAMDVKALKNLYSVVAGADVDISRIEESMKLAMQFPAYEFRTTIVPIIRTLSACERLTSQEKRITFMTFEESIDIAKWIVSITGNNQNRYILQPFIARSKDEMMDERFCRENLPKDMHKTPKSLLEQMKEAVKTYLPNCRIRGEYD